MGKGAALCGDANVLELVATDAYFVTVLKTTEMYILKVIFMLCECYLNKTVIKKTKQGVTS